MKRALMTLVQLAVLGGLALAGLAMTLKFISTILKLFAFILGEWIYTALILFVGGLFILIPVGYAVSVFIQYIENSKKEPGNPYVGIFRYPGKADEKEEE